MMTPSGAGAAARVRSLLDSIFNQAQFEVVDDAFTPDAFIHDPGHDMRGPGELVQGLRALHQVFPDFHFTVLDEVASGDRVAIRFESQGTHSAEFLGVPATGKKVVYTGLMMVRLDGERIAEFWAQPDFLGIVHQLGARIAV